MLLRGTWLVLFGCSLACVSAAGQQADGPANSELIDKVVKQCDALAISQRTAIELQLAGLKKQSGKGTFKTIHDKNRLVAALENKLRVPNGQLLEFQDLRYDSLAVGDLGYLPDRDIIVLQVISPSSSLVHVWKSTGLRIEKKLIWLETDTTGWTDGESRKFNLPTTVVGTKTYANAAGSSNTILHAKALDSELLRAIRLRIPAGTTGVR